AGGEALVLGHVLGGHADTDLVAIGNWAGRIAHELVEDVADRRRAGRLPREPAVRLEVERPPPRPRRRPGAGLPPNVVTPLEYPRLGVRQLPLPLEVVLEEGQLDLLAIEKARLGVELDVAQRIAVGPRPAAVPPRSHDQHVAQLLARLLLHGPVGFERAEQ